MGLDKKVKWVPAAQPGEFNVTIRNYSSKEEALAPDYDNPSDQARAGIARE